MSKTMIRLIALLAVLALLILLVPSAAPVAVAEDSTAYPVYEPQTLTASDVAAIPYDKATPYAPHKDAYLPDDAGYVDPSISVRIETMRAYDTTVMLAWIQIAHPSQLRAALYRPYPSTKTALVNQMAKRENAVIAINGDWFTERKEGYIVRNADTYKEKPYYRSGYGLNNEVIDVLIIDENADLHVIRSYDQEKIEDFINNSGHQIIHSYSFGPALVVDGEISSDADLLKLGFCNPKEPTQRIALCQMEPLSYLIVATEGPENKGSVGLTVPQFAQLCHDLGAKTAYNFDGGSSSCVAFKGKKINSLSTHKNRPVGDILYFVTAMPEE